MGTGAGLFLLLCSITNEKATLNNNTISINLFWTMRVFRPACARVCSGSLCQRSLSSLCWRPSLHHATVSEALGRKKGGGKGSSSTVSSSASADTDIRSSALSTLREKLALSLERLHRDLSAITAGRASPELLAKVTVEAHGAREPVNTQNKTKWGKSFCLTFCLFFFFSLSPAEQSRSGSCQGPSDSVG